MRRRREDSDPVSLDSFVDIVTNTLGLLILVTALVLVGNRGMRVSLPAPVMKPPAEGKERVIFECRLQRVVPLSTERANGIADEFWNKFRREDHDRRELKEIFERRVEELNESDMPTTEYHRYRWDAELVRSPFGYYLRSSMVVTPNKKDSGDRVSSLLGSDCEFVRQLDELDPEKHWLFIITRSDSFDVMRVVRRIAEEKGFEVGWHPMENGKEIVFSEGGSQGGRTDSH